jgi:hypothetical protein
MLDDFESRMEARDIIRRSFACVDEREQALVIAREVYSVPLQDLAEEYGVGAGRIRHLEARGLRKARGWLERQLRPDKEVRDRWWWRHGLSTQWRPPVDRSVWFISLSGSLVEILMESSALQDDLLLWRHVMGEVYRGAMVIGDENRTGYLVRYPAIDPVTQQVGPVVYAASTRPACKTWVDGQGWAT